MGDLEVKLFSALIIEFIGKDLYKKFIKTNPYLSLHFHKGINKKKNKNPSGTSTLPSTQCSYAFKI